MNVSLTTKLARFVEDEGQEGEYASASEVARDGLQGNRVKEVPPAAKGHKAL